MKSENTFLILLICLSASFLETNAQDFTVQGDLTYRVFYKGHTRWLTERKFSIKRSGRSWLIRMYDLNSTTSPYLYEETGCDGTNLFQVKVEDVWARSWLALQGTNDQIILPDPKTITVLGEVSAGEVPNNSAIGVVPLWLTFAATPYLKGIKDGWVKNLQIPDRLLGDDFVKGEWLVEDEAPKLIKTATFHSSGMTVVHLPNGEKKVEAYAKPYDQGFVDASFVSDCFTNIYGFRVPLRFEFRTFWPSYSSSNDLIVASSVVGKITQFTNGIDIKSFYPKLIRKALVEDTRFKGAGIREFNYTIEKDGDWLQVGDKKLDGYLRFHKKNYLKLMVEPQRPVQEKQ